jgi:hypothetical protein
MAESAMKALLVILSLNPTNSLRGSVEAWPITAVPMPDMMVCAQVASDLQVDLRFGERRVTARCYPVGRQ